MRKRFAAALLVLVLLPALSGCSGTFGNLGASGNASETSYAYYCTFSIECSTILDNMDLCDEDKIEEVPEDGWILHPKQVGFNDGETVFDILLRVCMERKIHMEHSFTPLYGSEYIEGIHNLYEFDVGELSGWMYSVNGWFPNYGCSSYYPENGDVIEWRYTCDLGYDVGGGYMGEAEA